MIHRYGLPIALLMLACGALQSAPAPYPLTIDSRAQSAPPVLVYKASGPLFRVSFVDGTTASDITGATPFMSWATNSSAAVVSTSSYAVVSASTGLVDFAFSPASVNHAAGRYIYEVGVVSGGIARVYRQGVFVINGSPFASGASAVTWTTNVDWNQINWSNIPDYLLESELAAFATTGRVLYATSAGSATTATTATTAATVTGEQSNTIATALQAEVDPVWTAVSNTVTLGAALGATALQSEADTLASVTARGNESVVPLLLPEESISVSIATNGTLSTAPAFGSDESQNPVAVMDLKGLSSWESYIDPFSFDPGFLPTFAAVFHASVLTNQRWISETQSIYFYPDSATTNAAAANPSAWIAVTWQYGTGAPMAPSFLSTYVGPSSNDPSGVYTNGEGGSITVTWTGTLPATTNTVLSRAATLSTLGGYVSSNHTGNVAINGNISVTGAVTAAGGTLASLSNVTNIVTDLAPGGLTIYLAGNTASDIPGWFLATSTYTDADGTNAVITTSGAALTNGHYIASFATAPGVTVPSITPGNVMVHVEIEGVDGSPDTLSCTAKAELYRLQQDGTVVDELDDTPSKAITDDAGFLPYSFSAPTDARYDMAGYRLGIRLALTGVGTVAGTDSVSVRTESNTVARLEIPVNQANYALAAEVPTFAQATNIVQTLLPGPGCTLLSGVAPEVSGASVNYLFIPTNAYTLSVSASAPRYNYSVAIQGTNACTLGTGISLVGTWTPGGTNLVVLAPCTGTLWRAYGRAY